ncbi:YheC/YheD family protein [Brevibacillus ginsengisoli]|uniref:YheC/YheD family endospore coat-associated protein n=1 Tax=Brevibacillus ginsengisoli TaxID=363854 RepID=UPI003CF753F8
MSYVPTMIQAVDSKTEEYGVYLPSKIIRECKIPLTTLTIEFGSQQAQGTIIRQEQKNVTQMTVPLLRTLRIPIGLLIQLRYDESAGKLIFGPYMGILLSRINHSNPSQPFAGITSFVEEIADVCRKQGGIVSVFTPNDIQWDSQSIRAMIRRNGTWRQSTLPLPQCIYNRLPTREVEQTNLVSSSIQRFKDQQIPFFNEQFLNKWDVYEALAHHQTVGQYFPKTVRLQQSQDLKEMLADHRMVYVKPTSGSMGRGIYRIYNSSRGYHLQYAAMNGSVTKTYKEFASLYSSLNKRIRGKSYLIQQGLFLIGVNRKPADFRALVQKNRRGKWSVTSLVARIGQNSIVSNVARGGTLTSASRALSVSGPWRASVRPSPHALSSVALEIAQELEQSLAGHYAEMGIDLGVDVTGRIWLLEVNSKPSKADNTIQRKEPDEGEDVKEISIVRKIRPSARRIFDYSTFLAGFSKLPKSSSIKSKSRKLKSGKAKIVRSKKVKQKGQRR